MTLFHIGGTEVRLHPAALLLFIGAWIGGALAAFFLGALALALHEYCHALVARALGYRVASLELLPFGGVARLSGGTIAPGSDFLIAFAGPVCSLSIAAGVSLLLPMLQSAILAEFQRYNLFLAFFNLLPGLPLDGGRMLRAVLLRALHPKRAARVAAWCGVSLAAATMAFAALLFLAGARNFALPVLGVFLLLGALRALRESAAAPLGAMLRRQDAFAMGRSLPVRHMAASPELRAAEALSALSAGRYTVLRVVGADLHTLGELDEGDLLAGIAQWGADVRLGKLLQNI